MVHESYSVKRGLNAFAKSVDPRQPAQSTKADKDRNFSLSLRYPYPEDRFLKSCYLGYFRCTKGNYSCYFGFESVSLSQCNLK